MNAFGTDKTFIKSLTTLLGAAILSLGLSAAPFFTAQAEDLGEDRDEEMSAVEFSYDAQPAGQDLTKLRELLSLPELSNAQRLRLERSLESMDEEMADASSTVQSEPQGIIDTVNTLLGIKTAQSSAQG